MRKRGTRAKRAGFFGRLMARMPSGSRLLYPLYEAAQLDTVEEIHVSPLLPAAFDGWKIAFVSDIHFGPLLGESRVRALAERVNGWQADIVILGGDYGEDARGAVDFWQLHPGFRAKTCVVATVGNHDRTLPVGSLQDILAAMRADGVTPVVNDAVRIRRGDATLALASTDDFFNGLPDLEATRDACRGADYTIFSPITRIFCRKPTPCPAGCSINWRCAATPTGAR